MKKPIVSKLAPALLALLLVSQAKAAVVQIGFDQLSNVFVNSSLSQSLTSGSYFAFGSFSSDTVAAGITQSNILSNLRSASTWFKSFETLFVNSDDHSYEIPATASIATDISPRQLAFVIYINDTLSNVQAALSGSATGITKEFGVFTYSNTNPALRAALPRDPAEFPADASGFSTETGLAAGLSNFTAVAGLGSVAAGSIVLIPEPTSVSLLLLGLGCVAVARRKTVQTTNSIR
jgi:hypothetical protein